MDCFEKTSATLTVTMTHGGKPTTQTQFKFFMDGTPADDKVTASNITTVEKSSTSREITATIASLPEVPEGKASYALRYEASLVDNGQELDKAPGTITVWVHKAKFTPRCPDSSITKPFTVSVMQNSAEKKKVEVEVGKACEFTLVDMAPYSIAAASPITTEAISDKSTGRAQEANFKKEPWTAGFTYPTPEFATPTAEQWQKQYVNVAVGRTDKTQTVQCGHTLIVKAGPKGGTALAGDKLYVKVVFTPENQTRHDKMTTDNTWHDTNWPKPSVTVGGTKLIAASDKVTYTGDVALAGSSALEASFTVELGYAGGDKCTISIGSTNEYKDAKLQIQNWRRIDYQLSYAKGMTLPATTNAEKVYKAVFIDLNQYKSLEIPEDEAKVGKNSWFDGTYFSGPTPAPAKVLVIGYQNMAKIKALMENTQSPTGTHVVLMHYQIDATDQAGTPTTDAQTVDVTAKIKFPPASSTDAWGVTLTAKGPVYPKSLADGGPTIKEAEWKRAGGSWTEIPADHIVFGNKEYGDKIHIKLPTDGVTAKESGKAVQIKVKYHYNSGEYNGFADGGHSFTKAYRPTDSDKGVAGVNGTIAHEIGHLIAQAPRARAVPAGLVFNNDSITKTYRHQGDHCADGADSTYDPMKNLECAGGHPGPYSACKCIMYGVGTDQRNADPKYCTRCAPFVKIEKILSF